MGIPLGGGGERVSHEGNGLEVGMLLVVETRLDSLFALKMWSTATMQARVEASPTSWALNRRAPIESQFGKRLSSPLRPPHSCSLLLPQHIMPDLTLDDLVDDGAYAHNASDRARIENQLLLDEFDRKKKARNMAVPTDDKKVKARLREMGEPITLFGERVSGTTFSLSNAFSTVINDTALNQPADRRDRLIYVLSVINAARGDDAMAVDEESESESEDEVSVYQLIVVCNTEL